MKKMILAMVVVCVLLAGCSTMLTEVIDPERLEQVTGIDKHSSYPAVRRDSFEKINLLELVDPEKHAAKFFKENWDHTEYEPDYTYQKKAIAMGAKYDLVLAWFRQRKDISDEEKSRRRNSIQERMLSVSISRCNVFKTYLRRDQADKNFLLGTATTVAAVLGAVLPGADAARYLAGTAGIFSGIRSEYNQAYFDGLCSVVEGLDQASASVDATTEPGMDAAMRTVLRARLLKEAADMPREMLLNPKTLDDIGLAGARLGLSLVGSARGVPVGAEVETDLFTAANKMVERINAAAKDAALLIEKAALERKKVFFDKLKDNEKVKELTEKGPREGEIVNIIKPKLTEKLLNPLKLDACYAKLAAGAVQKRKEAAKQLGEAKDDADRAAADLAIGEAARAIAAAHEKLRTQETLVMLQIAKYRDARIKEVQQVELAAATTQPLVDLTEKLKKLTEMALVEPPGPTSIDKLPCTTP